MKPFFTPYMGEKVLVRWSRNLFLLLALTFLFACQTQKWPSNIPKKQLFIDDYIQSRGEENITPKKLRAHLTWIQRFYLGSFISPLGWNSISETFLASIDDNNNEVANALVTLGLKISMEWAKDDDVRKINTKNIIVWGNSLNRAIENNEQLTLLAKIEQDVDLLLNNSLHRSDITEARYYPNIEEDYNF